MIVFGPGRKYSCGIDTCKWLRGILAGEDVCRSDNIFFSSLLGGDGRLIPCGYY